MNGRKLAYGPLFQAPSEDLPGALRCLSSEADRALEAINALKGCKHLNPDQKQYLDDISNRVYHYEHDLPHGRGPRQVGDQKPANGPL